MLISDVDLSLGEAVWIKVSAVMPVQTTAARRWHAAVTHGAPTVVVNMLAFYNDLAKWWCHCIIPKGRADLLPRGGYYEFLLLLLPKKPRKSTDAQ